MRFWGREPALVEAFLISLIALVSAFFLPLNIDQQGVLNAVVTALLGLVTAAVVAREKLVPAILGFVKSAIAVGLAFGLALSPEQQSVLLMFVGAGAALFIRTQVVAPVPADQAP